MRIALMAAMAKEIAPLREKMKGVQTLEDHGVTAFIGTLEDVEVVLVAAGIGKVAAAMATAITVLLAEVRPDAVINFGVAGALSPHLARGDVILADAVAYHDVDVSAFGYEPGQVVGYPARFASNESLLAAARHGVEASGLPYAVGLLSSGDQFVHGAQPLARLRALYPEGLAVDMEAAAMAQVCHQLNVPFMAVRAVSDGAGEAAQDEFLAGLTLASERCALAVAQLLRYLPSALVL